VCCLCALGLSVQDGYRQAGHPSSAVSSRCSSSAALLLSVLSISAAPAFHCWQCSRCRQQQQLNQTARIPRRGCSADPAILVTDRRQNGTSQHCPAASQLQQETPGTALKFTRAQHVSLLPLVVHDAHSGLQKLVLVVGGLRVCAGGGGAPHTHAGPTVTPRGG
jgi:hypothetical protein